MAEDNTEVPVWGDELKYLINTAGSESPLGRTLPIYFLGRRRR